MATIVAPTKPFISELEDWLRQVGVKWLCVCVLFIEQHEGISLNSSRL